MLFSIGRVAAQRMTSRSVGTSSRRVVVARLAAGVACQHPSRFVFVRSIGTAKKTTAAAAKPKKAAAEKKVAEKPTKKAAVKAKPKKKVVVAKKPVVKKVPKVDSPSKIRLRAVAERRELKAKALFNTPKPLPVTPWVLYVTEQSKGVSRMLAETGEVMSRLSTEFKALPESERQRLTETAAQNKITNGAAYKSWIESHHPSEIENAIKARYTLKHKYKYTQKGRALVDERQPRMKTGSFAMFTRARWASGSFINSSIVDANKQLVSEWQVMSEAEKQPYHDLAKADLDRYEKEVESVLGRKVRRSPSVEL